jgi:UDP-glucose:(heptosyl)LPS alpha-1,3-glucosyltransferase
MAGLDICYSAENSFRARAQEDRPWLYRLTPRYRTYCRLEDVVFGAESHTALLLLSARQLESYRRHHVIEPSRTHLVPPAIARDRMHGSIPEGSRTRLRAELGIPDDARVVLGIGSGFRTKGVDRSLAAIADLPQPARSRVRFLLIGRGSDATTRRYAGRLGIADLVRTLGARDDVPSLLGAADLLLHPARDECTGTVILEAVVAGCPVLCTANCGYGDHVARADAGIVLPEPFDPGAMTRELLGMLDPERLRRWSRQGIAYGKTADLYGGVDAAADLIERILQERARE